jgi:hypothetical protein
MDAVGEMRILKPIFLQFTSNLCQGARKVVNYKAFFKRVASQFSLTVSLFDGRYPYLTALSLMALP